MPPRIPLQSISGNSRRSSELTPVQRAYISGRADAGENAYEILRVTSVPKSTVYDTIQRSTTRPQQQSQARISRPRKLSERDYRHLVLYIRQNPRATYRKVTEDLGLDVSRITVQRILRELGITNWVAKKRPFLSEEAVKRRLEFCRKYRSRPLTFWHKVIWSDECSAERGKGKERLWVFRFPDEKYDKEMVQTHKKGKDISVMVWAAFSIALGRSQLVVMERDETAKKQGYSAASYLRVLEEQVPTLYEPGMIFQQDNAPIHNARTVRTWLKDMSIETLEWPPYSPDLNPIEHLWWHLKKHVYTANLDIDKLTGSKEDIEEALGKALQAAWELIPQEILTNVAESMNARIEAVVRADGWYTKY